VPGEFAMSGFAPDLSYFAGCVRLFSDDLQALMPMIAMVEYYEEVPTISESKLNRKCQSRV